MSLTHLMLCKAPGGSPGMLGWSQNLCQAFC